MKDKSKKNKEGGSPDSPASRNQKKRGNFRIAISEGNLDFRSANLQDPLPLGRQILEAAGIDPDRGFSLFAILPDGDFEDVRLDETFDLRKRGVERFVAFLTDRDFKLTVRGDEVRWGKPLIGGTELLQLAKLEESEALYLVRVGEEDDLVSAGALFDLNEPRIENFVVGPKPTYKFHLNGKPKTVENPEVTYEQLRELSHPQAGPNMGFTITYTNADACPEDGELFPGESITIKRKGTIINVTPTTES